MRWSKYFIPTLKEEPKDAELVSHKLMVRAGLIRRLTSGVYSYLPLGFRVLDKIERIIREEMNAKGAHELMLPALQPAEIWHESSRYKALEDIFVRYIDRNKHELILGPTHEEVITDIVRNEVRSYKNLPLILYQIQTKFRDELRPRGGVIRSREFIMKDAYSFDKDEAGLSESYDKMYEAYNNIFRRCGLNFLAVEADTGVMGGDISHEFVVLLETGEDPVMICDKCSYAASLAKVECAKQDEAPCPKCKNPLRLKQAIELGHVFKLGTKYSAAMNAKYLAEDGAERPVIMGCYGIGVNRIAASVVEQSHDKDGIVWPVSITPFDAVIIIVNEAEKGSVEYAEKLYKGLADIGVEVLLDDRDERAGVKFKDADLIGIPLQVIVGERDLAKGVVELKLRRDNKKTLVKKEEAAREIKNSLDSLKKL